MIKTKLLYFITLYFCIPSTYTGPNNLHIYDGTSPAEVIGGDVFFEITDPVELEYTYRIRPAKDFGASFNESFRFKNIPLVPVMPKFGCEMPANSDDVEGSVALIERGDCSFKQKALVAERSGARAVIITDIAKVNEEYFIEMVDDETSDDVGIPVGYLMGRNGNMILNTLAKLELDYAVINLPVNLTFTPVPDCSFKQKALVAERSGARAVIITDIAKVNEEYFIEMVDDETSDDVGIPVGYLMGRNGNMILNTLAKLELDYAVINLPVNLTFTPIHKMNQPPWLGW